MRIKTQFLISIITFSIILIIIGTSVALTQQQIDMYNSQEVIAHNIQTWAIDLNYISNNYFLYQDNSSIGLWQANFTALSRDLATLNSSSQQKVLIGTVGNDMNNLDQVFAGVVSFLNSAPRNVSVRILPSFQTQWSKMAVQIQALSSDSQQLSQAIRAQTDQAIQTNTFLTVAFLGVFAGYLITSYFITYRRTLTSIAKLKDGIRVIGSGELDYTIDAGKKDEIADISKSVNQMAINLKTVTASKTELEMEISERKKAEQALSQRNEELERLQVRLEEKAAEVEEYASRMEELAEERAKRLQDAERLAAIGATAGMVGHDIRNPLQAMTSDVYLANSDLDAMPEGTAKEGIKESLDSIEKNVEYVNKIVADLQDFARPLTPASKETNIEMILDDILVKKAIPDNIEVSRKVEAGAKKLIGDPDLLKRILANLVNNAVQAMPKGGKLDIQAYRRQKDLVITVEDTGVGIPEEVRPKLFTPLFTTKSKGQGFGLAVVKRMTEALGGTVTFESETGKGTKFIVHLPQK